MLNVTVEKVFATTKPVFSFDAETNGLWGQAFAIAAVLFDENGAETARFVGRCPIEGEVNPWVKDNVLPEMEEIPVTHKSYKELLKDFIKFYMENKEGADVLVHMGVPVESKLFIDAHNMGILGDFDGPYPLVDCSAIPEIGTSVDTYNANNGISIPSFEGGTHNPLYDSYAAALAYRHWLINR